MYKKIQGRRFIRKVATAVVNKWRWTFGDDCVKQSIVCRLLPNIFQKK
jgi:hypothetical protein